MVTSDKVGNMIEGQYSNYVLQKMMDTAPPEVNPALMEVLRYEKKSPKPAQLKSGSLACLIVDNAHQ